MARSGTARLNAMRSPDAGRTVRGSTGGARANRLAHARREFFARQGAWFYAFVLIFQILIVRFHIRARDSLAVSQRSEKPHV